MNSQPQELLPFTSGREFLWCTGIEDTFISAPWTKTGRVLDEYELTGHYARFRQDAELIASLGVKYARYGIPWYRIQPERNRWDWDWADEALESLTSKGVQPILDLMHYGTPAWLTDSFADPDYPARVADYAQAAAERYGKNIKWYTPLNEPRITAYYCGRIGWWPPNLRGWPGFLKVMLGVAKGIQETQTRIKKVLPDCVIAHVDACDIYSSEDPSLQRECELRQQMTLLALDLVTGRIDSNHPLWAWLIKNGATREDLELIKSQACMPDCIGTNLYPMFSQKIGVRTKSGLRFKMKYAPPEIIIDIAKNYQHYDLPMFVSETATLGSVGKRIEWLNGSLKAVKQARAQGIPIVGYTWWPLFSLVSWGYRQLGVHDASYYMLKMGLWDLANKGQDPLERIETEAAVQYRRMIKEGLHAVGPIGEGRN